MKGLHISGEFKMYGVPEIDECGKYQGDLFYAKDKKDALDYLNKIKELSNESK